MSQNELLECLQQDIEDLKGLIKYKEYGLSEERMKKQARAIILNLQDQLNEIIQN